MDEDTIADISEAYNSSGANYWQILSLDHENKSYDEEKWCVRSQMIADEWFKDYDYPKPIIFIKRK